MGERVRCSARTKLRGRRWVWSTSFDPCQRSSWCELASLPITSLSSRHGNGSFRLPSVYGTFFEPSKPGTANTEVAISARWESQAEQAGRSDSVAVHDCTQQTARHQDRRAMIDTVSLLCAKTSRELKLRKVRVRAAGCTIKGSTCHGR